MIISATPSGEAGIWGKKASKLFLYWYQVQASPDGVADIIIGKFFRVGYFNAAGINPAYKR